MARYSASRGIRYAATPGPESDRSDAEETEDGPGSDRLDDDGSGNGPETGEIAAETDDRADSRDISRADRPSCRADD